MRFWDLFSLITENLRRRKGRVILTAVGVVIGTASVVLLVSLATGLQQSATSSLYSINDLTQIDVSTNNGESIQTGQSGGVVKSNSTLIKQLTINTIEEIEAIPGVERVIPREYMAGNGTLRVGKMESWANMIGVETSTLADFGYETAQGTLELHKGTAIVGAWMSVNFYDPKQLPGQMPPPQPDLLNQRIQLILSKYSTDNKEIKKTVTLQVVGILKEMRNEADGSFYVSMEDLSNWNVWFNNGKRINRNKDGYNNVTVKAKSPNDVMKISEEINKMGFLAYSPQSYVKSINSFFIILQIVFGGIGAIALLVAAIGIANTMTMAILERTREIGLMKAIGTTNKDVLTIFLGEAAGIGFLGGLGGAALGWGGSKVFNLFAQQYLANQAQSGVLPTNLSAITPLWLLLFAMVFATLIGFLSGLYPALRAATLEPVLALKYE
jgi:putative ABC transport system permease protein